MVNSSGRENRTRTQRSSSIEVRPPSKFVFHWRPSFIKGRLPSKIVFHQRSSSIEGRLPSKIVFHQRTSSIEGHLPSKIVFHQRSSSIKGALPWKVIFHQRLSYIKCCLPSKVIFRGAPELTPSCPQAAPELPPKWIKQYELGRLDNKLTGTGRQTDRQAGGRTGPRIESGWRSD